MYLYILLCNKNINTDNNKSHVFSNGVQNFNGGHICNTKKISFSRQNKTNINQTQIDTYLMYFITFYGILLN